MAQHYLLWASGEDRPGIVATVTKALFSLGSNLEDSSMMRLGSEFAMFLIFTLPEKISDSTLEHAFKPLRAKKSLTIGIKPLSARQAGFRTASRNAYIVSVHGQDRPGLVYRVTETLAKRGVNVTDLSTHRTTVGRSPGYILFIEGELSSARALAPLKKDLARLASSLRTKIDLRPVNAESL